MKVEIETYVYIVFELDMADECTALLEDDKLVLVGMQSAGKNI